MADQGVLFDVERPVRRRRAKAAEIVPREWPGGIRPWDPIDQADTELGWQYPYVTTRRAADIGREVRGG